MFETIHLFEATIRLTGQVSTYYFLLKNVRMLLLSIISNYGGYFFIYISRLDFEVKWLPVTVVLLNQ